MAAVIGSLRAELSATIAQFQQDMGKAADTVRSVSKEFTKVGNDFKKTGAQMQAVGTSLTKTLTLPIAGAGLAILKVGIDFESAFAGVRKTVQATEPELQAIAAGFRNLAKTIPVSVTELARLGEAAGALGIAKENIVEFTRVMALLGVTTNVTSDQAAESIAKIQAIFGAAGKDTEQFASALVDLGNKGASTEGQILELATRIAGAGNAIGLTQAQVLGFAAAIANVGIDAEAGGSAISRVFNDLSLAVSAGGDDLQKFAAIAGTSAAKFAQAFRTDAAGATESFIAGLARIKASGGDLNKTLTDLGFTEIRQADLLRRLAGSGDNLAKSLGIANTAWREHSALTQEAGKRFETTASQLTVLWQRFKDLGITLFTAIKPGIDLAIRAISALLPYVESLAKAFAALPGSVQLTVVGMAAFVAALGPAIFIAGQMVSSLGILVGAFGKGAIGSRALIVGLNAVSAAVSGAAIAMPTFAAAAVAVGTAVKAAFVNAAGGSAMLATQMGILRTVATSLWAALWPIAIALGAIVVAFKVSEWTGFTDVVGKLIAKLYGVSAAEYDATQAAVRLAKAQKDSGDAAKAAADQYQNLKDRLSGALAQKDVEQVTKAVRDLSEAGQLSTSALVNVAREIEALQQQGAKLTPELVNILNAVKAMQAQVSTGTGLPSLTAQLAAAEAEIKTFSKELIAAIQSGVFTTDELAKSFGKSETAIKLFEKRMAAGAKETKKAVKDLKEFQETLAEISKIESHQFVTFFGLPDGLEEMGRAFEESSLKEIEPLLRDIEQAARIANFGFKGMTDGLENLGEQVKPGVNDLVAYWRALGKTNEQIAILRKEFEAAPGSARTFQEAIDAMIAGTGSLGQAIKTGLVEELNKIPQTIANAFTGGGDLMGGIKAIASGIGAVVGGAIGLALGGKLGGSIGAAIGSLAGPLVGLLADVFHDTEAEKLARDIGRDLGVKISEGLAKSMEANSKKFGRVVATMLDLNKIIEEAGGIESFGLDKAIKQLRDTFAVLGTGGITVKQIAEVFDENFGTIIPAALNKTTGLLKASAAELVKLGREAGITSQALTDFITGQVETNIIGGLKRFAAASTAVTGSLVTSQQAADALAGSLAVAFAELQRAGTPILDIVNQIEPIVASLQAQFEKTGFSGGAAFDRIRQMVALAKDEIAGPTIDAISGLGQTLAGLSNIGALDQSTFAGLTSQITEMFNRLVAGGADSDTALRLLREPLQTVFALAQDFGFAVDEGTQALLGQAQAAGVVGEAQRPIQEQMLDATKQIAAAVTGIAEIFGVKIPQSVGVAAGAIGTLPIAAQNAGAKISEGIGGSMDNAARNIDTKIAEIRDRMKSKLPADVAAGADAMQGDIEQFIQALERQFAEASGNTEDKVGDAQEFLSRMIGSLPGDARDAARDISDEFGRITIPTIQIHYEFIPDNEPPGTPTGGGFQTSAFTAAQVAGFTAGTPVTAQTASEAPIVVHLTLDGQVVASSTIKQIARGKRGLDTEMKQALGMGA